MKPEEIKYEIVPTKEEVPTIVVTLNNKKIPLHSKLYPKKETSNLEKSFVPENYDVIIVLGVGLGYHLVPLSERDKEYKKIILIDIIGGIEKEIAHNKLTSFLTQSKTVSFLTGMEPAAVEEKLTELLSFEEIKGINVLEHAQSLRVMGEYYNEIKGIIKKIIDKKAGSLAAQKTFGSLYLRNIIRNLKLIRKCKPVKDFFGSFKDYPALIITSGPSLEYHLEMLKEHEKIFFIIAVDSALPVLTENDIKADFVISIDPQPYIYEHFQYSNIPNTVAVFSISVNSMLFNRSYLAGILSLNTHPISQIVSQLFNDPVGSIDSLTGSVAGDAVSFTHRLGFRSIGLMGFDFSFSDYSIYSRGTAYQKRYSLYFQNRISPVECFNYNYIMKSSKGFKVHDRFTRRSFLQYKESLEDYILKEKINNIFNINNVGIAIKGAPKISFDKYIETGCHREINKNEIIKNKLSSSQDLGNVVSTGAVKDFLNKVNVFDEVMKVSLGNKADSKIEKFRKLIDEML